MKIISTEPKIIFSDEEVFVDHKSAKRSGHLGHAMIECKDGTIIAFYSNCSDTPNGGHNMYGWVEYKRSFDRGITWGEPTRLEYSYDMFIEGQYRIGCEKAVVCDDGTIVLFCLRSIGPFFEPYSTPVCLLSHDNGYTWSEPISVSDERGRIFDAIYRDGKVLVLEFCNTTDKGFACVEEGANYKLFASDDNGKTFYEYSTIPFNNMYHQYGNLIFRPDSSLVFYAYNERYEYFLTTLISHDNGKTWSEPFRTFVERFARNPQVAYINGMYIMHGRSAGHKSFVVYYSKDALNWSEGKIVSDFLDGEPRSGFYSNNIVIKGADGVDRLLVQYSENYSAEKNGRVNVMHAWIEVDN